jgi:outer membrane autotransporter protein
MLGVQTAVTDELTLGVAYAASHTSAKEDLRQSEIDTNTGVLSAHYQPNAWWLSGLATYSRGQYEEEKYVLSSVGKATYNVDSWGVQVVTGYDIQLANGVITPEVGLRYLSVKQEGYTDTLGTTVEGVTNNYLTVMGGVNGMWDLGGIRPTAGFSIGYDVISDNVGAVNTLANGATYTVTGDALDKLSATVSTGLEADINSRTKVKVEYNGSFRKEYTDHAGMIRFELKF